MSPDEPPFSRRARPDKARRKASRRQYKEDGYAVARATLGLEPAELDDLHAFLEARWDEGCDHTLRFTEARARERGHDVEAVVRGVSANGGFCDCEVLANVTRDRFGWPEAPES